MPIRHISPESKNKDFSPSMETEQTVFRRSVVLKTTHEINTVEECTLHNDLKRRKRKILTWTSLNLLVMIAIFTDLFSGFVNIYLLRIMQSGAFVVCVCNILYYAYAFFNVHSEVENQKFRLKSHFKQTSSPTTTHKMEFVQFQPHSANTDPSYWNDFQSIFRSFKRMTARNKIAFFPNDSHHRGVNVTSNSPPVENTQEIDSFKYKFSETMTKYKGRLITSARDLRQYLTDHKKAEQNEFVKTSEDLSIYQDSGEFWSTRRRNMSDGCLEISPLLRRSEYQISPNCSSDSSICSSKESGCTNQEFFSVLSNKFKIEPSSFIYWISNFRMWLSKTVLSRLITEINVVDNGLRSLRLSGITIGNVSLETLEDALRNPTISHQLPSLSYLIPFLRFSTKQHYIVERFRTLAQGHGMGDFKWNVGGDVEGKPWERGYPTDAELLLHLFSTYLDQQLPLSPCNSDTSKPFSSNYLADSIHSLKQKKVAIIRQAMSSPHYDLVIDNEIQEIPPGRNNLFYALVLFLYFIKVYEHGMLGRISLGKHGINMLWIIDDKGI